MRNKRGVTSGYRLAAGSKPAVDIRLATVFDAFEMSDVITRSITQLCAKDHKNDPAFLADWLANKTPEGMRDWIKGAHEVWVITQPRVLGVGTLSPGGAISALYLDPASAGHGLGAQLLDHLELRLKEQGHTCAKLEATQTALGFYERHGWKRSADAGGATNANCLAMRKSLT